MKPLSWPPIESFGRLTPDGFCCSNSVLANRPTLVFLITIISRFVPIALRLGGGETALNERHWASFCRRTSQNLCVHPESGGGALPCVSHFPPIASKVYCLAERRAVG